MKPTSCSRFRAQEEEEEEQEEQCGTPLPHDSDSDSPKLQQQQQQDTHQQQQQQQQDKDKKKSDFLEDEGREENGRGGSGSGSLSSLSGTWERCCVVCERTSPRTIFSCRYKVHDRNAAVLQSFFAQRDLRHGELCDRCYRLWYKHKRNKQQQQQQHTKTAANGFLRQRERNAKLHHRLGHRDIVTRKRGGGDLVTRKHGGDDENLVTRKHDDADSVTRKHGGDENLVTRKHDDDDENLVPRKRGGDLKTKKHDDADSVTRKHADDDDDVDSVTNKQQQPHDPVTKQHQLRHHEKSEQNGLYSLQPCSMLGYQTLVTGGQAIREHDEINGCYNGLEHLSLSHAIPSWYQGEADFSHCIRVLKILTNPPRKSKRKNTPLRSAPRSGDTVYELMYGGCGNGTWVSIPHALLVSQQPPPPPPLLLHRNISSLKTEPLFQVELLTSTNKTIHSSASNSADEDDEMIEEEEQTQTRLSPAANLNPSLLGTTVVYH